MYQALAKWENYLDKCIADMKYNSMPLVAKLVPYTLIFASFIFFCYVTDHALAIVMDQFNKLLHVSIFLTSGITLFFASHLFQQNFCFKHARKLFNKGLTVLILALGGVIALLFIGIYELDSHMINNMLYSLLVLCYAIPMFLFFISLCNTHNFNKLPKYKFVSFVGGVFFFGYTVYLVVISLDLL